MEIQVGEYIRTKEGYIAKLKEIEDTPYKKAYIFDNTIRDIRNLVYEEDNFLWKREIKEYIVKHSFNIIDLIEVGDYVNGIEVVTVYGYDEDGNDRDDKGIIEVDDDYAYGVYLEDINIKSIVTKEQFESIKYEV